MNNKLNFEFDEYAGLDEMKDHELWFFTGSKDIINEMFSNKYPEAIATELCLNRDAGDDVFSVSISPTKKTEDDGLLDYDWRDIDLSDDEIRELIELADKIRVNYSVIELPSFLLQPPLRRLRIHVTNVLHGVHRRCRTL